MSYCQQIYNRLRQHGLSEAGALGMLGNGYCESNCEPFRVQGDFSPYRTISKAYVTNVENDVIDRYTFAFDGKGFGIFQLTYHTRKDGFWKYWKASGQHLDSADLQCDYAVYELKQDYPSLFSYLCQTNDLYEATSRICREFERPAVNNIDARFQAANSLKYEIDLDGKNEEPKQEEPKEAHALVLSELQIGSTGDVVVLLQAALNVRGYNCGTADGIFGAKTQSALNSFKRDRGQQTDGKIDALTWAELLKVGG